MPVTWGGPNTHEETPDSDGPISAAIWSCKTPLKSMRALWVIWLYSQRTAKSRRVSFSLSGAEKGGKWVSFQLPGRCRGPWNKRRIPADKEADTTPRHPACGVCAMGNAHTKFHYRGGSKMPPACTGTSGCVFSVTRKRKMCQRVFSGSMTSFPWDFDGRSTLDSKKLTPRDCAVVLL